MSWDNSDWFWGTTPPSGGGASGRGTFWGQYQADFDDTTFSSSDAEIESQLDFARRLVRGYERRGSRDPQTLQSAVRMLELTLARLHPPSTFRPEALCQLCYAHTSIYISSDSMPALDEAIRCGRLARDEGLGHGFRESNSAKFFDCYCKILNDLGVALSHRGQRVLAQKEGVRSDAQTQQALRELDEAIEFARENKNILDDRNSSSELATLNLASRLLIRGSKRGTHVVDHAEALRLLKEIRQTAPTTSTVYATACLQIGQLEVEAFRRTKDVVALDAALPAMADSARSIPKTSDVYIAASYTMQAGYLDRHQHTGNATDLVKALLFSTRILDAPSLPQAEKNRYLLSHMSLLHKFALVTMSLAELDGAEQQALNQLKRMPRGFPNEFKCYRLHCDVVLKRYLLSKKLEDLNSALLSVYTLLHDESGYLVLDGRRVRMNIGGYYRLRLLVARLVQVSPNRAKEVACDAIYACLSNLCKPPDLVVNLTGLDVDVVKVLEVYEGCAKTGEVITKEVAESRAAKPPDVKVGRFIERQSVSDIPRENTSTASTGQPTIAGKAHSPRQELDPTGSRPVSKTSGFDATIGSMSSKQLAMRQAQVERQSIQQAKAEGKNPNPRLCLTCRSMRPLRPIDTIDGGNSGEAFEWNPDMVHIAMGTWDQLRRRQNCSICRLILTLIDTDSQTEPELEVLHPHLANQSPKTDGTRVYAAENQHTGERVLTVEYNQRVVGHLKILPRKKPVSISAYFEAQLGPRDPRHGVTSNVRKADPEVLRQWLSTCQSHHKLETCNQPTLPGESRYSTDIPLVLVDVFDRCLVPSTSATKYFSLSYVRGSVDLSTTLRSNYASRCQRNGLPSELPATFEDAISLVRSIGERYLWIDALCIVQDDKELKDQTIGLMDVVYRKAFATIVALLSTNASGGILGVNTPWCRPERKEILAIDVGSYDLEWTKDPEPPRREKGIKKVTIELIATPPRLDLAVAMSEWHKRGWTYQERLLSRRCLYFSDRTVYFRCGVYVLSDGGVNGPVRPVKAWWGGHEEAVVENTLSRTLDSDGTVRQMGEEKRTEAMLAAYTKAVEKYTSRELTQDGDIINAFSGILSLLTTAYKTDHLCGLPSSAIEFALLWTPVGKTYRRGLEYLRHATAESSLDRPPGSIVPTNRGTVQVVYAPSEVTALDDKVDRQFPSWSWTGWKGPVDYRLFDDMREGEPPATSLIDTLAINLGGGGQLQFIRGRSRALNESILSPLSSGNPVEEGTAPTPDRESQLLEDQQFMPNPSFPNVLQLLAPSLPLTKFKISPHVEYISSNGAAHLPSRQAVRAILDSHGQRCGLWWEQAGYVYVGRGLSPKAEAKMVFVAVSRHRGATTPRSGPNKPRDETAALFDGVVYPKIGPGSGLVNVLAVDLDMGHEFGERVTVARIHEKAWKEAGPSMRLIRLA